MEILLGLVGLTGLALLLQAKALPSEADFKKAKEKLAANPDDPDANKVAGRYLAFVIGDYDQAMPFFSKSSDEALKAIANHELDKTWTDTAPKKVGMGDEWVIAAKKVPQMARIYYERAAQWYAGAWPSLDGIWKDRTREQLRKLFQNPTVGDPRGVSAPAGWKAIDTAQKASPTSKAARNGKMSFQVAGSKNPLAQYISLEQVINVVPGKTYDFSAWVLPDGTEGQSDQLGLTFFGPGSKLLGINPMMIPADQPWWHHIEGKVVAPDGAQFLFVQLGMSSKNGNLFLDDVSLKMDGKEQLKNPSFEDR